MLHKLALLLASLALFACAGAGDMQGAGFAEFPAVATDKAGWEYRLTWEAVLTFDEQYQYKTSEVQVQATHEWNKQYKSDIYIQALTDMGFEPLDGHYRKDIGKTSYVSKSYQDIYEYVITKPNIDWARLELLDDTNIISKPAIATLEQFAAKAGYEMDSMYESTPRDMETTLTELANLGISIDPALIKEVSQKKTIGRIRIVSNSDRIRLEIYLHALPSRFLMQEERQ
jgi:hypothetical protein